MLASVMSKQAWPRHSTQAFVLLPTVYCLLTTSHFFYYICFV